MPPPRPPHLTRRFRALRRARWATRSRLIPAATVLALASALPGGDAVATGMRPDRTSRQASDESGQPDDELRARVLDLASGALGTAGRDPYADVGALGEAWSPDDQASPTPVEPGEDIEAGDVPEVALQAYLRAQRALGMSDPECGLEWTLLAAIGRVESNHGRFGGARLGDDGTTSRPIRGIPLDGGPGVARIADTDGGELDGDETWDRAVGPMQFIPATWERVAVDADADGARDPDNIFDAALGAAVYLCAGEADLTTEDGLVAAVLRYNHSDEYVETVLYLAERYQEGESGDLPDPGDVPDRIPSVDDDDLPPGNADGEDGSRRRLDRPFAPRTPRPGVESSVGPRPGAPGTTRPPAAPPTPTTRPPATPAPPSRPGTPPPTPGRPPAAPPTNPPTTAPPTTPPTWPGTTPTTRPGGPGTTPPTRPPTTRPPTTPTAPPTTAPPTTPPTTVPPDPTCPAPGTGAPQGQVLGALPSGQFSLVATGGPALTCLTLTLPTGHAPTVENTPEALAAEWRVSSADGRHVVWGLAPAGVTRVQVDVLVPDDAGGEPQPLSVWVPTVDSGLTGVDEELFAGTLPTGATIQGLSGLDAAGTVEVRAVDVAASLAPVAGFDPDVDAYVRVTPG